MLYVAVKWKDGTVTHRTYNDPYVLEKQYTETASSRLLIFGIRQNL